MRLHVVWLASAGRNNSEDDEHGQQMRVARVRRGTDGRGVWRGHTFGGDTPGRAAPGPELYGIAPAIYMGAGNECAIRLTDETDGALTAMVGNPGGRAALAVCARQESGDWVMVDGTLGVESVTGEASIVPRPLDSASMFAGAPASLDALAVGHVRITVAFDGLTGAGVVEVVAE